MTETPQVRRYEDPTGTHAVHVAVSAGQPAPALSSWGTVDMSQFPTGLTTAQGREVRVELVGVAKREFDVLGHVLASCALDVATGALTPVPDAIFPDAVSVNDERVACRHALLTLPFMWGEDGIPDLDKDDRVTTWLQVVPVTDAERVYAGEHGADALAAEFERTKVDVLDPWRPSAV